MDAEHRHPVAIVTGASRGLGRALAEGLAARGWRLVIDARDADALAEASQRMARDVVAIAGDVTDPAHRAALIAAADDFGGADLLVNNAGSLGPSPLPALREFPVVALRAAYEVNVVAPLALSQLALPSLRAKRGSLVMVSSDAAVDPYPGWGGYGSAKAAVDQLAKVFGVEEPDVRCWSVDPGDLRTQMHQEAFPGEDISDRPEPASVVPSFLRLLADRPPSGRIRLSELLIGTTP
jgi:NAD(P)-dependent dehydrogenase (short-subunit alcohol dehydrogenase family)